MKNKVKLTKRDAIFLVGAFRPYIGSTLCNDGTMSNVVYFLTPSLFRSELKNPGKKAVRYRNRSASACLGGTKDFVGDCYRDCLWIVACAV